MLAQQRSATLIDIPWNNQQFDWRKMEICFVANEPFGSKWVTGTKTIWNLQEKSKNRSANDSRMHETWSGGPADAFWTESRALKGFDCNLKSSSPSEMLN